MWFKHSEARAGRHRTRISWLAGLLAAALWTVGQNAPASQVQITYSDGPNEGFNDTTPYTKPPYSAGNPTTLGQARRTAFEAAAGAWGCTLSGNAPITISASMDPLGGTATSAVGGRAGANYIVRDFPAAAFASTWYSAPLFAHLINGDPAPGTPMIGAQFNSDIDNSTVLGTKDWYYGTDGNAGGDANFFQVVLHEFGHGLGFSSGIESSGAYTDTGSGKLPFVYDQFLTNGAGPAAARLVEETDVQRAADVVSGAVFFDGARSLAANGDARAAIFAPSPYQNGSSTSHLDQSTFENGVNALMCPVVSNIVSDAGPVGNGVLRDIGWTFTVTPDDKHVITGKNTPVGVTLTATDTKSLPVTFQVIRNPAHGALSGSGANLTYTPNAGYVGTDSFAYTATDGCATSPAATASIDVAAWVPTGVDIPSRFGMGGLLATQTRPTGFGNNLSELNQLFAKSDGTNLNIGVTGNLENNGNGAVFLLDTKSGGTNVINYTGGDASGRINELNGDMMDADFLPDYAVDVNNSGGTLYVDLYDLQANTKTFLGQTTDGGPAGALTGGGSVAFNNSNTAGVSGTEVVDGAGYPLAASATTGVELSLPLSQIGASGTRARLMAVVIGNGGFVSNQLLPGLPDTYGNLGNGPTNYQQIPGEQVAQLGLTSTANDLGTASVPWAYTAVYLSGSGNNDAHPPVTSIPTVFDGIAYVAEDVVDGSGDHSANIVAIDALDTGTAHLVTSFGTQGRVTGLDGPVVGRIAVYYASGVPRLYAMTTKGSLYMMDAGTGANLRSLPVFPGGSSVSTPAVTSTTVAGVPNVIVAGKQPGGLVELARVLDEPAPLIVGIMPLLGSTDVFSSPSVIADGSRVQIATVNGASGAVYTVDALTFTVFNQAFLPGPVVAAPVLTQDPPGRMLVGSANGPASEIYAFNASNAGLIWATLAGDSVQHSLYVDYRATPNLAYVGNDGGILNGVTADTGAPWIGFPASGYPDVTGSPLLLKPSIFGPQGSLYVPTASGMYVANSGTPSAAGALRFPVSGSVTTPSASGAADGSVMATTGDIGASTSGTTGPTGFTGGNVYGLAVQAGSGT